MLFFDLFALQVLILLIIYFLIKVEELYQVILLAFNFLIITALILYVEDFDILTNFLLIIDLGVFIILFLFSFNSYVLFNSKVAKSLDIRAMLQGFIGVIVLGSYITLPLTSDYWNLQYIASSWTFFITYYDYYLLLYTNLKTDLQVLREIYFILSIWEFFVVNLLIIYGVLFVLYFYAFVKRSVGAASTSWIPAYTTSKQTNSLMFLRLQSFMQQKFTAVGVRVWSSDKSQR